MTDAHTKDEAKEQGPNRVEQPFGVNVTYPENVNIRMVDASTLGDYEFSILVSGFCCNAAVGFSVAAFTIPAQAAVLWPISGVFGALTFAFVCWAHSKRRQMTAAPKAKKSKD